MTLPLGTAKPKPKRGSYVLDREREQARIDAEEDIVRKFVQKRDKRCRWPERHKCRGGLEVIHIRDRSLGGAYVSSNLFVGCKWIHRSGPESIHSKDLKVECETEAGADGPLSFWRTNDQWEFYLVRREIRPFEYEHD